MIPIFLSVYFWHLKNIFSPQCGCPMIQKQLNLVKEWRKYWKLFNDKHMFGDGWFNLTSLSLFFEKFHTNANNKTNKTNKLWHISTLGPVNWEKIANFQIYIYIYFYFIFFLENKEKISLPPLFFLVCQISHKCEKWNFWLHI